MAEVINENQIKLNSGKTVQAQQGGWYDGQQFWGGTLSQPGQINPLSNQQGAGQAVSQEVIAQTNPANVAFINQQRQNAGLSPSPTTPQPAQPSVPSAPSQATAGTTGKGLGVTAPETINLPQLYEGLYEKSGIRDIEAELSAKTNAYNEQVAKIKDNPYLSEARMTGRIKKLDEKFSADTLRIRDDIAMRKADIETQLNLQTKQFDINSQQAQLAFSQFQSLLSAGALDNASGEDIANLTRSTGISSTMIQSAINATKEAKKKDIPTSTIKFDDGTNQGFAVINTQTGDIINKQIVAPSKPAKATGVAAATKQSVITDINTDYGKYINNEVITFNGKTGKAQKLISPEAFYRLMVKNYPSNINSIPTAKKIREVTGQ